MDTRRRFWIDVSLAALAGSTSLLTTVWPDWIELAFRVDPDHGNGSVETIVTIGAVALFIAFVALARRDRRRARQATALR